MSTFSQTLLQTPVEMNYPSLILSMDDHFVDIAETPLDENGNKDFKSIHTIDFHLMCDRIKCLFRGEMIPIRKYDFRKGHGEEKEKYFQILPDGFILLAGMHGFNPLILNLIGTENVTKIYVSPMMPLLIDAEHCFDPTDLLLIRRVIRDSEERGYSLSRDLRWWPDIVRSTWGDILPYINQAQIFYGSSTVFE